MTRRRRWLRATSVALVVAGGLKGRVASAADQATVEQLVRELEAMKQRMEKVEKRTQEQEQTIRRQNETIRQLTGGRKADALPARRPWRRGSRPPAWPRSRPPSRETDLSAHDEALKQRGDREHHAPHPAEPGRRRTRPSHRSSTRRSASSSTAVGSYKGSRAAAISSSVRASSASPRRSIRSLRGYAIINGTQDGVEVEEAAIVTTSLPYNLGLKGGRFFADFGRLSKFHDHDLPFVNRPHVLDEYVGASRRPTASRRAGSCRSRST